jgi:hypothetical protein
MNISNLPETDAVAVRVAIGQQVVELFKLKVDPKTGWITTTTGKKSLQGIGSTLIGIIESEVKRLTEKD